MGQAIADFWDTSDVPQDDDASRIPSYPSLESLDQEHKEELSDIQYAYYNAKREAIMKKLDAAYEIYSAHLKEYEEADPKKKTQKYLLQYNDISNRLHGQFEVVTSMLGLPFKETLDAYPSLDSIMRVVEQEDLREKGESFFEELMGEMEVKNAIAAKVYQNKSLVVTSSKEETEMTKEFEEYKKESKRLMDFCKRMRDKRGQREEYEGLEQPQGVPDVKPISKRDLDEKMKEALITPKKAQIIGEDTIPPQYSREISRYEPPIPVKEKVKEDLIEKVREITSGESKGSRDERQVEGETELSWNHEGLEPYPSPERPKPQRDPKEREIPKENIITNDIQNRGPKSGENQEEGKGPLRRAEEKLILPKQEGITPKRLERDTKTKRDHPKEGNGVDKNTEQWVNDQKKFWEEKRGSLEETIPKVFEPQGPIRILQRGKQPQLEVAKQTPIRTGVNRDFWSSGNGGPNYRKGYQMGYPNENGNWGQRNGYGRRYGNGNKNQQRRAHGGTTTTQTQTQYTTPKGRVPYKDTPSRRRSGKQGDGDGNGEDIDDKNRKKYKDTKYDFEEEDEEESDTEDSFEFEITPQQLSQVTPGGGVLKLTLTKKGPLKITTEAQKKPDPSQTTPKTVYDPTKERDPLQGSKSIKDKTTYREREGLENQRIKPKETPHDKRGEGLPESGGPVRQTKPGGDGGPNGNGGPDKGKKPPRKDEGPPNGFRKINGGGGGSDPSDDDGDGGGSIPPSSEGTPPTGRRHRRPKLVYVLQGPPGPPGQVGQPGQAGRDGQTPQITKALEDALKTQKTSWDTTNLENSFDYFGRTMHEILKAQQKTTQNLEEQFKKANETQEFQTEAMQDIANANFQMKFDHMFASVPMYDGSNPYTFDDWLYQIESLCEMSHRYIRIELMGRASAQVKRIIRSIPVNIEWEVACRELKRCLTEEKGSFSL